MGPITHCQRIKLRAAAIPPATNAVFHQSDNGLFAFFSTWYIIPTTDPPMARVAISFQLSASSHPRYTPHKIQSQVPETPAQMGQMLNGKIRLNIHAIPVIIAREIIAMKISIIITAG